MAKASIMVVEDDQDIRELVIYNLGKEGYTVVSAESGEQALKLIESANPDLIVLDIMLPGMDGIEVLRSLKQGSRYAQIPVIMATAKSEDSDIITGLELGADDYIAKPFSPKVLIARIRSLLRRTQSRINEARALDELVQIGPITLDAGRHEVSLKGQPVDLSATEFAILEFLMRNPGWVFSRNQIIDAVRGKDYPVTERSVDVQILGLRKKLGEAGNRIETVRGVGYRFQDSHLHGTE
ncbi:MAG TPA: response regulator transcription factor [Treponema sp.]|nr:response regulator transcription factor [Treponema sp.]HPC71332.1 response regulator transcription factor [Treponema sp.]HRS03348.1 response regulator transcription factor [Treponema sp.]HRU27753.1 response regulator transcription factor [Treponema sp.]